jgi:hypothetical protein
MKASTSSSSAASARAAEVVLDVEVEDGRVHIVLANCGDAVATAIEVEFSRTLAGIDDASAVSDLLVFKRLGVLRPGRTLRVFWNSALNVLESASQRAPFTATVTWSERGRRRQRAIYRHDLSIYSKWPACADAGRSRDGVLSNTSRR